MIDFVYADDCPNVEAVRANLEKALAALDKNASWLEYRIGDPNPPQHVRGYGSPTILVNGRDIGGVKPAVERCCRVYETGGGVPSVELILTALESFLGA